MQSMTKTEICLTKQNKKARHMRPVPNANYGGQTQITCFVLNLRIVTPLMMGELLRKAIINVFHWSTSKRGARNPIDIIIAQNVHKCNNKIKHERNITMHKTILLISSFIAMLCNISVFIINIQLKKIEKKRQNDKKFFCDSYIIYSNLKTAADYIIRFSMVLTAMIVFIVCTM